MRIIGLNQSNDSAAARFDDGRIVAAAAQERFSRRKHDPAFPSAALAWLLHEGDMQLADADAVAFFWNPVRHMDAAHSRIVATPRSQLEYLYSLPNQLLAGAELSQLPYVEMTIPLEGKARRLFFVTHHLAHAAHAFYESPFTQAAILTVDGYGERASTLISRGDAKGIHPLREVHFPHSIGSFYAALTQFLGFKPNNGEGKVMGLASYGQDRYRELMEKLLRPTVDGFEVDLTYFAYYLDGPARYSRRLVAALGEPRAPGAPIEARHQDIAASLQAQVERVLVHLARLARREAGASQLAMAGGVTLNCVANEHIAMEAGFDECFFQPACHDAGASAGAALYVAHQILGHAHVPHPDKTDYLGPHYSPDAIQSALRESGLSYREVEDPEALAASQIARGRIVGRFSGRAEFGPRALGNRSILASPGPESVKDHLNARVKRREPFRPFAPSILAEACGTYFDRDTPSPFMIRAYQTRPEHRETLGAITHVDGSARVQTVRPEHNPGYARLLAAHGTETGVPCVLNTSFNIRGEPIVNSPEDAIRCFASTGLDDLLVGPFALSK